MSPPRGSLHPLWPPRASPDSVLSNLGSPKRHFLYLSLQNLRDFDLFFIFILLLPYQTKPGVLYFKSPFPVVKRNLTPLERGPFPYPRVPFPLSALALEKTSRLPRASFTPFLSLLSLPLALGLSTAPGVCILCAAHKVFFSSFCAAFDCFFMLLPLFETVSFSRLGWPRTHWIALVSPEIAAVPLPQPVWC